MKRNQKICSKRVIFNLIACALIIATGCINWMNRDMGTDYFYTDSLVVITGLLLGMLYINKKYNRIKSDKEVFIFFYYSFILFLVSMPLMNDFLVKGEYTYHYMLQIEAFYQAILSGKIIAGNLFFCVPALFKLIGVSTLLSYKLFLFLINLLSLWIAYYSYKELFGTEFIVGIAVFFQILCSYRIVALYNTGVIEEMICFSFFPLLGMGIYQLLRGDFKKWIYAALGLAGCIQSCSGIITIIFLISIILLLLSAKGLLAEKQRVISIGKCVLITVLMSSNQIAWAFNNKNGFEIKYQDGSFSENTYSFFWLLRTFLADARFRCYDMGDVSGEMLPNIGISLTIGVVVFLSMVFIANNKYSHREECYREIAILGWCGLITGGFLLFSTSWLFPWKSVQVSQLIQEAMDRFLFPQSLLAIVSFMFSLTTTTGLYLMNIIKDANNMNKIKIVLSFWGGVSLLAVLMMIDGITQMNTYETRDELDNLLQLERASVLKNIQATQITGLELMILIIAVTTVTATVLYLLLEKRKS